jgi:hypothetical protein
VIEWHLKDISTRKTQRLAFFYCHQGNSDQSQGLRRNIQSSSGERPSPEIVLRSLLAQLAWSTDGFSVAERFKQANKDKLNFWDPKKCANLLMGLINDFERTTIIIDALDECADHDRLLLLLNHVAHESNKELKFFFSSRPNVTVPASFPLLKMIDLDSERLTANDLENYVKTQVMFREKLLIGTRLLKGEHPELETELIKTLTERAGVTYVILRSVRRTNNS